MKLLRWGLFGLCGALVFGVALAPARAILASTPALVDVRGPWWRGDAGVLYRGEGVGRFSWTLDPLELFSARLGAHWRFENAGRALAGRIARGLDDFDLEAAGEVAAATVNRVAAAHQISMAGTFTVADLRVRSDAHTVSANGLLDWTGGRTTFTLGGRTRDVELPAMAATLATQSDAAVLDVRSAAADLTLLEVRVDADGLLQVRLTRRLLALAGNPWPGSTSPDDFVLSVAERCFAAPEEPFGDDAHGESGHRRGTLAVLLESQFSC